MIWRISLVTIILVSFVLSACRTENNREIDEIVSIGTHSLHIRCLGQGSPTVVIDTGVGDTLERWSDLHHRVFLLL